MFFYRIAGMTLRSECCLSAFCGFECEPTKADVILEETDEFPPSGIDVQAGIISYRRIGEGWFFHPNDSCVTGIYANKDYTHLKILGIGSFETSFSKYWFIRLVLECWLTSHGYISLHSAAVEVRGEAFVFTGPSGIGKSTRANAWIKSLGARLISGDRPMIDVRRMIVYGVPWDGEEQCFRNVHYPLKVICDIRRSNLNYIRSMSIAQCCRLLQQRCFVPGWDSEIFNIWMNNISGLAARNRIVRAFSGIDKEDVKALYKDLQEHHYLRDEADIKAKASFIVRNTANGTLIIPETDKDNKSIGAIRLNEVSAFIWGLLQNPISKEDLLMAVLDEFSVDRYVASANLDTLLETLNEYDMIEEEC